MRGRGARTSADPERRPRHGVERQAVRTRFLRYPAVACVTLLAYGCVTPMALDRNELNRLKDEPSIAVVYYRAPDFIVAIPEASSLFGGGYIYMATAKSAGERMIRKYGLQDPTLRVRDVLISALAAEPNVKGFEVAPEPLEDDNLDTIRARFPKRLVLDFKADLWTLQTSEPLSEQRRLFYYVRARLLRTEDGTLISRGYCTYRARPMPEGWDDLTANGGALLKARLEQAADACAAWLRSQMLTGDKETSVK